VLQRANEIPAGNPHLDPVFPTIVDKNNERTILRYAINRYARRSDLLITLDIRSQHRDVIIGFAIPVAQLELFPLGREARREMQTIHFQPEP
jgi:hypothetical protein